MSNVPFESPRFGDPPPPAKQSNTLGLVGFIVSLVGLLPCGALSPIGLLLSLIAVFKPPRGFAIAGLVIGAAGSLLFAMVGLGTIAALSQIGGVEQFTSMLQAQQKIEKFAQENGELPDDESGQAMVNELRAADGPEIRYHRLGDDTYEIVAPGADKQFDTPDDNKAPFTVKIDK